MEDKKVSTESVVFLLVFAGLISVFAIPMGLMIASY